MKKYVFALIALGFLCSSIYAPQVIAKLHSSINDCGCSGGHDDDDTEEEDTE